MTENIAQSRLHFAPISRILRADLFVALFVPPRCNSQTQSLYS